MSQSAVQGYHDTLVSILYLFCSISCSCAVPCPVRSHLGGPTGAPIDQVLLSLGSESDSFFTA